MNIIFIILEITCKWNDWVYGDCSKTCGIGTRTNTRTKAVVEANGGNCDGHPTQVEECNTKPCPGRYFIL